MKGFILYMEKSKFVLPGKVLLHNFDVQVKPYLTLDEVNDVAQKILECENTVQEEIVLNQYLLEACCDVSLFDGMLYETIKQCGFFAALQSAIVNLNDVYKYVENEKSINKQVSNFLLDLSKVIKDFEKKIPKNAELKNLISKYETVIKNGNNKQ